MKRGGIRSDFWRRVDFVIEGDKMQGFHFVQAMNQLALKAGARDIMGSGKIRDRYNYAGSFSIRGANMEVFVNKARALKPPDVRAAAIASIMSFVENCVEL